MEQEAEEVVISEGVVKEVSQFKYLGSVLVADGKLDIELNIRFSDMPNMKSSIT